MPALPPPSVRALVERSDLGLSVLAGDLRTEDGADRAIRWVAVSELEDPTPFLEGGELVLSTGMRLAPDDAAGWRAYVARLVRAGVAAYGLGVGLTHDEAPRALVSAARRRGLVVLEVPEATPFMAVTRAVSDLVAAQEYASTTRAVETQRDLTRAALGRDPVARLAGRLARGLDAWVLVVDDAGRMLAATPEAARGRLDDLAADLEALAARGAMASAAFDLGTDHVAVHPLGTRGSVGHLVLGRASGLDPTDRALVAVAVSLLSLVLERPRPADGPTARPAAGGSAALSAAAFRLLVEGVPSSALPLAELGWTALGAGALRFVRVTGAAPVAAAAGVPVISGPWDAASSFAVVRADDQRVAEELVAGRLAGGSGPSPLDEAARGWQEATRCLVLAQSVPHGAPGVAVTTTSLVWHDDRAATGLLGLMDPGRATAFADELLAPLDATGGRADLLASTRAYLSRSGQWDAAAADLGVHRHTLRYRIRRVEELLGRTFDDPDVRAEVWFALLVRGTYGSGEPS